jgi:hypothetical protein
MDKKVGWDDKEGKRQPRMIDIYVKPVGEYQYIEIPMEKYEKLN